MHWDEKEISKLIYLRDVENKYFSEIGKILNRHPQCVKSKYMRIDSTVKRYTPEEIAANRANLLRPKIGIKKEVEETLRYKKASVYLIHFPYTNEMKIGVSRNVYRRMSGFGSTITKLIYESELDDRYIVEFVEGYILNKFKNSITYNTNTIKNGGHTELFNFDINNSTSLIKEMQAIQQKARQLISGYIN